MTLNGRILNGDSVRLLRCVAATVAVIILIAFALSFNSQRELAIAAHIPELWAWGWPLIVDGTIIVATFAVLILKSRGKRTSWYPWAILIVFGALSIYANGVHATGSVPSLYEAFIIGAVPAIALLVSTHLLVMILAVPGEKPAPAPADGETSASGSSLERTSEIPVQNTAASPEMAKPTAPRPAKKATETPVSDEPNIDEELEKAVASATREVSFPTPAKTRPTKPAAERPQGTGEMSREDAAAKAKRQFTRSGEWPTGAEVGRWMGKSAKSGQRVLAGLKDAVR